MIKYCITFICIVFLSSCYSHDKVKEELHEIKRLLAEISIKLSNEEKKSEILKPGGFPDFSRKYINHEALNKIQLPDNPSKKEILKYFKEISIATQGQNTFSHTDPQVNMLLEVGHENLEYLVSYNADHTVDYYFNAAIRKLAEEEDKELILRYLPIKKELVKVVFDKNWQDDAKPVLVSELNELPYYLPIEWIKAVASLNDPCTHEGLKNYLIYGSNRSWTYKAINTYTIIPDIKGVISEAWANVKKERDGYSRNDFAPIAASYGYVDALEVIVKALDNSDRFGSGIHDARKHIFQLTEVRGTNEEIRIWYKKNKDNLVFNKKLKKFIIKQQKVEQIINYAFAEM